MRLVKFFAALFVLVIAAYGMMHIKQQVQNRTRDLLEVKRQIAADKEALHVLKAEWAYLNQPERIKRLADQHLEIHHMAVKQVASSFDEGFIMLGGEGQVAALDVTPTLKATLSSFSR